MRDAKGNDDCFLELCGVAPTKDNNCKSFNWQSAERSEPLGPEPIHPKTSPVSASRSLNSKAEDTPDVEALSTSFLQDGIELLPTPRGSEL